MDFDKTYIIIGLFFMFLYSLIEAINLKRLLHSVNIKKSLLSCYRYAIIGFFFSGVTPSATGGQPMQMIYMHNEGVDYSESSFALLNLLFCYQIAIGTYGTIGYIINFDEIMQISSNLNIWFFVAIMINFVIVLFIGILIFKWQFAEKIIHFVKSICYKINSKFGERITEKLNKFVERYRSCSEYLGQNKKILFRILCNSFIQYLLLFSIPFLVFKGFRNPGFPFLNMFFLQSVLYIGCGFIPLPGALAVTESLFLIIFQHYFSADDIGNALIISRTMSLYLPLLIYGILSGLWMNVLSSHRN